MYDCLEEKKRICTYWACVATPAFPKLVVYMIEIKLDVL